MLTLIKKLFNNKKALVVCRHYVKGGTVKMTSTYSTGESDSPLYVEVHFGSISCMHTIRVNHKGVEKTHRLCLGPQNDSYHDLLRISDSSIKELGYKVVYAL